VIVADLGREGNIGADEGRAKLGDKLLHCLGTRVPVEEPSTASETDLLPASWIHLREHIPGARSLSE